MSKFLPTYGIKWVNLNDFDSNKHGSDSSESCVLEVDLECPEELHKLHNDYPLAPAKKEI